MPVKPTAEERHIFAKGQCAALALAISRRTGWDMVAVHEPMNEPLTTALFNYGWAKAAGKRVDDLGLSPDAMHRLDRILALIKSRKGAPFDLKDFVGTELEEALSFSLYHVYCLTPSGLAVDIDGVETEEQLLYRWLTSDTGYEPRTLSARELLTSEDGRYLLVGEPKTPAALARAEKLVAACPAHFGLVAL